MQIRGAVMPYTGNLNWISTLWPILATARAWVGNLCMETLFLSPPPFSNQWKGFFKLKIHKSWIFFKLKRSSKFILHELFHLVPKIATKASIIFIPIRKNQSVRHQILNTSWSQSQNVSKLRMWSKYFCFPVLCSASLPARDWSVSPAQYLFAHDGH